MFGIGFGEMVVIGLFALLAVGPDKLPAMVKTVSKTYRQLRRAADDLRASSGIDELLRDEELKELAALRKQKLFDLEKKTRELKEEVMRAGEPRTSATSSNHQGWHAEQPLPHNPHAANFSQAPDTSTLHTASALAPAASAPASSAPASSAPALMSAHEIREAKIAGLDVKNAMEAPIEMPVLEKAIARLDEEKLKLEEPSEGVDVFFLRKRDEAEKALQASAAIETAKDAG